MAAQNARTLAALGDPRSRFLGGRKGGGGVLGLLEFRVSGLGGRGVRVHGSGHEFGSAAFLVAFLRVFLNISRQSTPSYSNPQGAF